MVIKRDFLQEMIDHTYDTLKEVGQSYRETQPSLMLGMDWNYFIIFHQHQDKKTEKMIFHCFLQSLPFYPNIYRSYHTAITEAFK